MGVDGNFQRLEDEVIRLLDILEQQANDLNFQRLEDEVIRLLDILEQLRQENAALKGRVGSQEAQQEELRKLKEQLGQMESEAREEAAGREEMRGRIQRVLSRLDEIPH